MTVRFYSSVASEKTLTGTITSGQTTMVVSNTIGLPGSFPYTLAVDYETATEELVEVTNAAGTTLTITRAIDGTSASSHNAGARVRHVSSARDFTDSRNHENADDGIHGLSPGEEIVGTDKVQTLTNKTLTNAQGTLLNPDVNLTGTTTTSFTRTPAGGATVSAIELVNGTEQTFSLVNNGNLIIRNPVSADAATMTRRLQVTMSDGVTERFSIVTAGQATASPRTGTVADVGGFKVIDPGDLPDRKAIQIRDSGDLNDRFVAHANGHVEIRTSNPNFRPLEINGAAALNQSYIHVQDSAAASQFAVESTGRMVAFQSSRIDAGTNAMVALRVQGKAGQTADLQDWEDSTSADVARIRADGSGDFTSVNSSSGIFTAAAGWSIVSQLCVVKAGIATIAIRLLRTGANIVADATGDLVTDPALGNVSAAFRPNSGFGTEFLTWVATTTLGSGSVVLGVATGDMAVVTFSGNGTIATGQNFHWTMSYPLNFT